MYMCLHVCPQRTEYVLYLDCAEILDNLVFHCRILTHIFIEILTQVYMSCMHVKLAQSSISGNNGIMYHVQIMYLDTVHVCMVKLQGMKHIVVMNS